MNKQSSKQNEAIFYYDKMIEAQNNENYEYLKYYISAFVNAARTIQQFTYYDAKQTGRVSEYEDLVRGNKVFEFFRDIRNDNIHEKLIETNRIGSSSMMGQFVVRRPETTDEQLASYKENLRQDDSTGITTEVQYFFEEWDGSEDVFTLANNYLSQLEDFISEAERRGIIQT